jgi:drug/metabolite transporter (DMT)-like permease
MALPAGLQNTRELVLIVISAQVIGNLALSRGMRHTGMAGPVSPLSYLHALLNPWIAGGVMVLALWMFANLTLLSRADLSFVLPVTSVSYVLIALAGQLLLHERVDAFRWIGIAMITLGVMLVGRTPARTIPVALKEEGE